MANRVRYDPFRDIDDFFRDFSPSASRRSSAVLPQDVADAHDEDAPRPVTSPKHNEGENQPMQRQ